MAETKLKTQALDEDIRKGMFSFPPGTYTRTSLTTINCPAGVNPSAFLSIGDKLRYTESVTGTTKYAYVVNIWSTEITITSGSDYGGGLAVSNDPTNIKYSKGNMVGFPDYFNFALSITNFTVGNATVSSIFNITNRRVNMEVSITLGNTSSVGASTLITNLPVASRSPVPTYNQIGVTAMYDNGSNLFNGAVQQANTTTAYLLVFSATGTFLLAGGIASTNPFTWATNYRLWYNAQYFI